MIPNVDLIMAALLHGAIIAAALTTATLTILVALLSAFVVAVFSIPIIDLHDAVSYVSGHYLESIIKPNIRLASFLALYSALRCAIELEPLCRRLCSYLPQARNVYAIAGEYRTAGVGTTSR